MPYHQEDALRPTELLYMFYEERSNSLQRLTAILTVIKHRESTYMQNHHDTQNTT